MPYKEKYLEFVIFDLLAGMNFLAMYKESTKYVNVTVGREFKVVLQIQQRCRKKQTKRRNKISLQQKRV